MFPFAEATPSRAARFARPRLEQLEDRTLPSAVSAWQAHPQYTATPAYGVYGSAYAYTPLDMRYLYNYVSAPSWLWGGGQTIAIVTAYDAPTIYQDLMAFDRTFGLPGQSWSDVGYFLTKVNQGGAANWFPAADTGWAGEASLDVEWAHAIAPYARIILVEANSSGLSDLLTAVNLARSINGVSVVSMSWGGSEFSSEAYYDGYFTTPAGHNGVTFVAASGDNGAYYGAEWPAASPNVLSVGGTSLYPNYYESGWGGSGGGVSAYELEPSYQYAVHSLGMRTTPDVSYDADPATGYYVYDSYASGGGGWYLYGGTSAGAPQWAALIALANNYRAVWGEAPLPNAQADLYALSNVFFRDITTGYNGYGANAGYDLVTGRGSPVAGWIIGGLAYYNFSNYGGSYSRSSNYAAYGVPLRTLVTREPEGPLDPGLSVLAGTPGGQGFAPAQGWHDPFASLALDRPPFAAGQAVPSTPAVPPDPGGGTATPAADDDLVWVRYPLEDE